MKSRFSAKVELWIEGLASRAIGWASIMMLWPRPLKQAFVVTWDTVLCVFAIWLAFSLRLGEWHLFDHWAVLRFSLSMLILWFPIAWNQRVYSSIFRYTGRGAMVSIIVAVGLTSIPLIFIYAFFDPYAGVPRTIAILAPLIFLMLISGARIVGRYILTDLFHSRPIEGKIEKRILIYGAGSLGQRLASAVAAEQGMRLVGFLDDDPGKRRQRLNGAPVWHSSEIGEAIARTGASDVLLAVSDASRQRKQEIVDSLKAHSIEVRILPPMREMIAGRLTVQDLRPIQIEDLLGRRPVEPDRELLSRSVTRRVILVTGAGGSIGSEICRQVIELEPARLILADASEFALYAIHRELEEALDAMTPERRPIIDARLVNVADAQAARRLFESAPPDTVFHAAAYKHVPLIEENVIAGVANNLRGTWNCAREAERTGAAHFILISTDKAVRPPNAMGASKRVCELMLQALDSEHARTVFAMVRFGNVLGSSGSVVPLFKRQIASGGPVTVTHREVTRYFMTIPEAAQLVIQAAGMAEGGDVFVLDMGDPVRIMDLARSMIQLAGLSVRESDSDNGDIAIVERGLRPGEKLFEELLIGECPLPTSHPRIMRARDGFIPMADLRLGLDAIDTALEAGDESACRAALRALVPTLEGQKGMDGEDPIVHGPAACFTLATHGNR